MITPNIKCSKCGSDMLPIWFVEEEEKVVNGHNGYRYKTGRKRKAVSHLECPCCFNKECVDGSLDEPWR